MASPVPFVDWPSLEELMQVLDVHDDAWKGEDYESSGVTRLERLRLAAIDRVKRDVAGDEWDDYVDEPDAMLAQAALRMAELLALRPELAASAATQDPTYQRLLFGHRRSFGIA